jgi:hypothetical protein
VTGGRVRPSGAALSLFLVLASAGCGGGGNPSVDAGADSGVDRGVDQGGATTCPSRPDLVTDAPVCNTVTNNAPSVPFTTGTGAPPTLGGGTIRDGLYEATKAEGFGTVTPSGRRLTLVILDSASQMLWSGDVLDAAGSTVLSSFTANAAMAAFGTQIALTVTCSSTTPAPLPTALTYQATATELLLGLIDSGGNGAITTYTRRGCAP